MSSRVESRRDEPSGIWAYDRKTRRCTALRPHVINNNVAVQQHLPDVSISEIKKNTEVVDFVIWH